MERDSAVDDRYTDLLDERADPDLARLIGDLGALYGAPEPPARIAGLTGAEAIATRAALAAGAGERARSPIPLRAPWRVGAIPRRVAVAAAAVLVAVALLAGGVYAVEPLLNSLFHWEPGAGHVFDSHLLQPVHESRQVGDFTVTIQDVYADANRVIIGDTVAVPAGHGYNGFEFINPVLTDQFGTVLTTRGGYGSGVRGTAGADLVWYDAGPITQHPATLRLHLSADGIGGEVHAGSPDVASFQALGPLAFDFTVPFNAGRVAELHQSQTVGGATVTLERVVVTPSETRVYLSGVGPGSIATLAVNAWSSDPNQGNALGPSSGWVTDDGLTTMSYEDALASEHGQWTLTVSVTNAVGAAVPTPFVPGGTSQKAVWATSGGPWAFHFNVP